MDTKRQQTDGAEARAIADEYPLYLRWGQLVSLFKRLGLGSERQVKACVKSGRIRGFVVYGVFRHYSRMDVLALIREVGVQSNGKEREDEQ